MNLGGDDYWLLEWYLGSLFYFRSNVETHEVRKEQSNSDQFCKQLKSLNVGLLSWISEHIQKTPLVDLTPVFDDYKKHLATLTAKFPTASNGAGKEAGALAAKSTFPDGGGSKDGALAVKSMRSVSGGATLCLLGDKSKPDTSGSPSSIKFGFTSPPAGTVDQPKAAASTEPLGQKPLFSFGASAAPSSVMSTAPKTDSRGQTSAPPLTFAFERKDTTPAVTAVTDTAAKPFSFGLTAFKEADTKSTEDTNGKAMFSFASKEPAASLPSGFSFGKTTTVTSGFTFGATAAPSAATTTQAGNSELGGDTTDDNAPYVPPKAEEVKIEEADSFYSIRCKLFTKKDEAFADSGVGTLYLKRVHEGAKTQLLIRAANTLGTVLLNVLLTSQLPISRMGKNNVSIFCPTEHSKEPKMLLIRVKTTDDADKLLEEMKNAANSGPPPSGE